MQPGRFSDLVETFCLGLRAPDRRHRRRVRGAVAALVCAGLLSGCGAAVWEEARGAADEAARGISALREAPEGPRFSAIRMIERPWLGLTRQERAADAALPVRLLQADAVTLPLMGIGEASVLARRIEAAAGIPVRFIGEGPGNGDASPAGTPPGFGVDRLSPDGGVWTGPLDALLETWTEPKGYAWRYGGDGGAIEIVRRESAVFRINALAGTQHYAASGSTDDAASGGDEGGGVLTRQSIAAETEYDPWPEIEAQAKALAGPGASVTAAPSSASVLVSGTPRDVDRVRGFLRHLNREVLRPVTLSVHVYTVRMEREADYDFGLAALVRELFGTSAQLAVSPESVAIVRPSAAVGDTLSATVRALSRAGTVSRVLSADIPSLNGKPAQFFELYKEAYVKEHRTTAGEGIAQTEIVPGTVSSGFAASYIPRITGPGEVLVRLFASLRDRPVFREVTGGGATIQLPAYASRAVQVTQRIRRGETLLVTGFSSRRAEADGSGTFTEEVPLPGGARRGALARTEQVLLVKAEIGAPLGIIEAAELPGTGERPGRPGKPL
ncbi:MAG: hypothetical protein OXP75_02820 [Rhodospirillales bacterium]|nr:hypothetical protein [Rhodospirillales bacterium]